MPTTTKVRPHRLFQVATLLASLGLAVGCGDNNSNADGDSAGGTDSSGETDGTDTDTGGNLDFDPFPGGMRRLLATEYRSSVEFMLGPEAARAAEPPADQAQEGFDAVGASILSLAAEAIELYERSATTVADAAIANPATLASWVPCVNDAQDAACYEQVARRLGKMAYRRDLEQAEVDSLVAIANAGRAWDDNQAFMTGIKYELMAILQSPSFLHLVEVGEPVGDSGNRRLTANELVARMSFVLLGRVPDLELLDRATAGELDDDAGVRSVAEQMMRAPEARLALQTFFDELLRTRVVPIAPKNDMVFPLFSPELGESMRQESLLLVRDVVWEQDIDFRKIFDANYTYINDPLAELYSMSPPGNGDQFARVDWPADQGRAGVTSQAAFLTHQSGPLRNSPTKRGRWVQSTILCQDVPAPPDDVVPELPEPMEGETLRERLERHMTEPACAGCHGLTDPVGFAFERYDAIGALRANDNGSPIDASGDVPNIGSWNNAAELGAILAVDERVGPCLVKNLMKGKLGYQPLPEQGDGLDDLGQTLIDDEHRLKRFLVDMTVSPIFRTVGEPK